MKGKTPQQSQKQSISRKRQKESLTKKCSQCGKNFHTFYKSSHLCSDECVRAYNSENTGRPSISIESIKEAIKPYLQIGCSLDEAILEAGICSKDTVYRRKKEDETFSDWIETMKNYSIIKAKRLVYKRISDGDKHAAMRRLERKKPQEFGKTIHNDNIHTFTSVEINDNAGEDETPESEFDEEAE